MKAREIKTVFFGTSTFAVYVLRELKRAELAPALIVTAPKRPKGRGLALASSPVSLWAKEEGIECIEPEKLDADFRAELQNTKWDMFFVASYGLILPKEVLAIPRCGVLNVHPSLLPKYRGPSPIQTQILENDRKTGVTIMKVDEQVDHGDILSQASIEIGEEDWPLFDYELEELLGVEGGKLLAETAPAWIQGEIKAEEQNDAEATWCTKIKKGDGLLDVLSGDPYQNFLKTRGLASSVGTYFYTKRGDKKIRVKITEANFKDGQFIITKVIPEGRKEMKYEDFLRGEQSAKRST